MIYNNIMILLFVRGVHVGICRAPFVVCMGSSAWRCPVLVWGKKYIVKGKPVMQKESL